MIDYDRAMAAIMTVDLDDLERLAANHDEFPLGQDPFIARSWLRNAIDCGTMAVVKWMVDKGSPVDYWLHAHEAAGAHVIVKFDGRQIPERVLDGAAALAAYYSASRSESSVIVDVTPRRYVRKIKGAAAGMVTYKSEQTRTVAPKSEAELDL